MTTPEDIKQLLTLWENGLLSRQDLIDQMPSVFSPPETNSNIVTHNGVSMEYHEGLIEQMSELQPIPQEFKLVSQELDPVVHPIPEGIVFEELPDIDLTQGIDLEADLVPFSSQEVLDAGMIYAPYIPLMQTPTLNISDLKKTRFGSFKQTLYNIPKHSDIYSDVSERFEILDL